MSQKWIPKTFEQACKRASGRRRYHARRRRVRDKRQMVIMGILVDLNWPGYGIGQLLADALSVDPATISRDLKFIRKWRASLIARPNMNEEFADAIVRRLVAARIHPRRGYYWSYTYRNGLSSFTVGRAYSRRSAFGQRTNE
jgi:hypothetical protein